MREFKAGDICISNNPDWTVGDFKNPEYELIHLIDKEYWNCKFVNPILQKKHGSGYAREEVCVLVKPKVYSDGLDNWE